MKIVSLVYVCVVVYELLWGLSSSPPVFNPKTTCPYSADTTNNSCVFPWWVISTPVFGFIIFICTGISKWVLSAGFVTYLAICPPCPQPEVGPLSRMLLLSTCLPSALCPVRTTPLKVKARGKEPLPAVSFTNLCHYLFIYLKDLCKCPSCKAQISRIKPKAKKKQQEK